jgi:hypothetical protein
MKFSRLHISAEPNSVVVNIFFCAPPTGDNCPRYEKLKPHTSHVADTGEGINQRRSASNTQLQVRLDVP